MFLFLVAIVVGKCGEILTISVSTSNEIITAEIRIMDSMMAWYVILGNCKDTKYHFKVYVLACSTVQLTFVIVPKWSQLSVEKKSLC